MERKWHVWVMEYLPKLTVISALLCIGLLKVMHFNDLHLLFTSFTSFEQIYMSISVKGWNIMGCYNFRVLYLQNYAFSFYETYRF